MTGLSGRRLIQTAAEQLQPAPRREILERKNHTEPLDRELLSQTLFLFYYCDINMNYHLMLGLC